MTGTESREASTRTPDPAIGRPALEWEETYRRIDGIRTFSRSIGRGREVVLLHGVGVSAEYWRPAQVRLAERGLRVHAVDLPGFGRSQDPPWPLRLPRLAHHVVAWIDRAVPGGCDLVGQSLGCEIAILCALERPQQVCSLTLAAPTGLPQAEGVPAELLRAAFDAPRETLDLYRAIVPAYLRSGLRKILRLLIEQRTRSGGDLLHQVRQPALILRGIHDTVVTAERQNRVARGLARAELATIPGAHAAHFTHPHQFARVVGKFLARQRADPEAPSSRREGFLYPPETAAQPVSSW